MTRLLLIRHGQSLANLQGRFAGHSDFPLTELGLRQAEATARYIAETYQVDAVYSSDLQRAYHTGLATANKLGLPITTDTQLREIFAGAWEGVLFSDLDLRYPEDIDGFRHNIGLSRCTEGESVAEMILRIRSAIDRIAEAHNGQTVAIACHGTPIRSLLWMAAGTPIEHMQEIPWPTNASVSEFAWEDGRLTLVSASTDAHLADLVSEFSLTK